MKPTQEQLNDPKWWDKYGEDAIYCYYSDLKENICFSKELALHSMCHLIGERPIKPVFVPEVGVECEFMDGGKWSKCKIDYISDDYIVVFMGDFNNYEALSKGYHEFRPIKSERDLFVEAGVNTNRKLGIGATQQEMFEALYDAGCRFMENTK